jgi:hypothetical protein
MCIHVHHQICGIGLNGPCIRRLAEAEKVGVTGRAWGIQERNKRRDNAWKALGGSRHHQEFLGTEEDSLPSALRSLPAPIHLQVAVGKGAGNTETGESRGGLGSRARGQRGEPCIASQRWGAALSVVRGQWLGVGAPSRGHSLKRPSSWPQPFLQLPAQSTCPLLLRPAGMRWNSVQQFMV